MASWSVASAAARADRGGGRVDPALRDPEQGEPGLGVVAALAGLPVGGLRLVGLAAQPVQLGDLVHRPAERRLHGGGGQPLAGQPRLVHRVRPVAGLLHDLGAVHQALPAVGHELGLGRAPGAERGGPLAGAAQVVDVVAGLDGGAVDEAAGDRPDLACGDRGHHLVEQGDAGREVTAHDQRLAQSVPAERHQVGLLGALADRGGLLEDRVRRRRPAAAEQGLERRREQQVAARRAVEVVLLDQSLTAGDPAAAAGRLTAHDERHRQPERAQRGPLGVVLAEVLLVGPLPGSGAVVVPAGQVGRGRELLEGGGVERCLGGRGGEFVGRGGPRLPLEGVASPVQSAGRDGSPPHSEDRPRRESVNISGLAGATRRGDGRDIGRSHRLVTCITPHARIGGCDRDDTARAGCL